MLKIHELFTWDIDDPPFFCIDPPRICRKECVEIYANSNEEQMRICPHLAINLEDGQLLKIIEHLLAEKGKRIDVLEQEIEDLKAQLKEIQHV